LTSLVQKRFKFPVDSVELYAEKVNNRGLCAIAQAESLRYKLLGGLAVRRYDISLVCFCVFSLNCCCYCLAYLVLIVKCIGYNCNYISQWGFCKCALFIDFV